MEIKLSAVIITFNESRNIRRCIESVQDFADEILVVDSFSTDDTESICREFGARFIQHPFAGHIEQKNYATSQAGHDYILSLDADEALDKTLKGEIKRAKQNWQTDGHSFNRLNCYCGKWIYHSGWYPDRKLRLFDRRKGHWGGVNPHDKIEMNKGATVCHLPGNLLHYSYYSISGHIQQTDKFTTIAAQAAFDAGKRVSFFQVVTRPPWQFFRDYFLKAGFLDGKEGFIICVINSLRPFLKYLKLYRLDRYGPEN